MKLNFLIVFLIAALALFSGCTGDSDNGFPDNGLPSDGGSNNANSAGGNTNTGEGLDLTVKDLTDPVYSGNNVKYVITIRNNGSETVFGLSLSFDVSSELDVVSASGEHEEHLGTVEWAIPSIAPGEVVVKEVVAEATESGSALVEAELSSAEITEPITATEETEIEE